MMGDGYLTFDVSDAEYALVKDACDDYCKRAKKVKLDIFFDSIMPKEPVKDINEIDV